MMTKQLILFSCAFMLTMASCTDPKQARVDELKTEAIAIHDEVMPRMGEITELGSALKSMRDEISQDTLPEAKAKVDRFNDQIKALDDAYEGMMQWMADYQPTYDKEHPLDSAVSYYEQQKVLITEVKAAMENSIDVAKALKNEQ